MGEATLPLYPSWPGNKIPVFCWVSSSGPSKDLDLSVTPLLLEAGLLISLLRTEAEGQDCFRSGWWRGKPRRQRHPAPSPGSVGLGDPWQTVCLRPTQGQGEGLLDRGSTQGEKGRQVTIRVALGTPGKPSGCGRWRHRSRMPAPVLLGNGV